MATYSFKSVGKTKLQRESEQLEQTLIPYGIKTPLTLGSNGEGIFSMNFNIADQLADNLRNLLLTNWGERLGQYYFGANLRPLVTEFSSQVDFDNKAINRIKIAVERWLPFITLDTFESTIDRLENKNTAVVKIKINYTVPALVDDKRAIEIVLYVL